MSGKSKNEKIKIPVFRFVIAVILLIITLFTVGEFTDLPGFPNWDDIKRTIDNVEEPIKTSSDYMQLHVIDIGQGDGCLVKCGSKYVLIDAGDNGKGKVIIEYLAQNSITHLDWIIATHPDTDHIGGLDEVLNSDITVGNFMMPRLPDAIKPTTETYKELLFAISNKGLKITQPVSGMTYLLDDAVMKIMSPDCEFSNANDYSVVLKFTYGEVSFLMTGDAERASEMKMVEQWQSEIKSDVIKVGHHGAATSTTDAFLQAVSPNYAAISVGSDNRYNHPTKEVLLRLKGVNAQCYRTDYSGDIVFSTDGKNITIKTER